MASALEGSVFAAFRASSIFAVSGGAIAMVALRTGEVCAFFNLDFDLDGMQVDNERSCRLFGGSI